MHQSRTQVSRKIPIPRKGTRFVVRALINPQNSVPVLIAVRDMLKLARTKKEAKKMIYNKNLKINGREVKDFRESIQLFNIFTAGKSYVLTLIPTGRFVLEESDKKERLCKVVDKKLVKEGKIQLNLHDGTNILTDKKISVQDSVYVDAKSKIVKHVPFEKGKNCFIMEGKYIGNEGKIESTEKNKAQIKIGETVATLNKSGVIAL